MYTKNFTPIIFLGILILSCEENNNSRNDEIKVGNYDNMIINYYDTTLIGVYGSNKTFNLDLDNNGVDDIQFESEIWGSAGLGHNPRSLIKCLNNNAKLNGYYTIDTLFLHIDTTETYKMDSVYYKYLNIFYSCHRICVGDSIYWIHSEFKNKPLDKNDILSITDFYNSDTLILIDDEYAILQGGVGCIGDTLIYQQNIYYNDCNTFPLDKIKYIGLLLDNERLGWIKISIFDKFKILILESCVQK